MPAATTSQRSLSGIHRSFEGLSLDPEPYNAERSIGRKHFSNSFYVERIHPNDSHESVIRVGTTSPTSHEQVSPADFDQSRLPLELRIGISSRGGWFPQEIPGVRGSDVAPSAAAAHFNGHNTSPTKYQQNIRTQSETNDARHGPEDTIVHPSVPSEPTTRVPRRSSLKRFSHSGASSLRPRFRRSVSFDELRIREFPVVLGDHPCCTSGLPVALGWECLKEVAVGVDQYERTRGRRKSRNELRLGYKERRELIETEVGTGSRNSVTSTDVKRAERRLHRDRMSSSRRAARANKGFFSARSGFEDTKEDPAVTNSSCAPASISH